MPAQEDVIALVVQRDDLAARELGLGGEEGAEEVRGQQTERGAEIIEDELGGVVGWSAVPGDLLAFHPVADAEGEGRP